ncbi:sn-glycerol-3-phosphate transporter [Candidatus Nitrotoga sp. BS]|nr:sn-glycerol-3-phosphate transporter [Candidatus Nitrotoga sp. BS]
MDRFYTILLLMALLLISDKAAAWKLYDVDKDSLYLWGGTYTHFHNKDSYKGANILVSLEVIKPNDHLYGLALFNNSFDQFSQYLFYGKIFRLDETYPGLHAQLTGGLIHGYRGEYKDNLFLNKELGVAPVIVPGIGYQKNQWGFDLFLLGKQGVLMGVGYQF